MYCRNCGKELTGTPEICLNCGARPLAGRSFCYACGAKTNELAEICIKCGVRLTEAGARARTTAAAATAGVSTKSRLVVTLLCALPAWFFGIAGIHRFYLGKIGSGIAMLLTLGGLGIWTIIDFIYAVSGNMRDKENKLIKDWQV